MSVFQFLGVVVVIWLACTAVVAAFFAHARRGPSSSPYPPEAAEAPDIVARAYDDAGDTFGFQRAAPFVEGNHPLGCADDCCYEVRMQELVDGYDWAAAERDMVRPWKGQAK